MPTKPGNPNLSRYHYPKGKGLGGDSQKFTFRIEEEYAERIKAIASSQGKPVAQFIRGLIKKGLSEY